MAEKDFVNTNYNILETHVGMKFSKKELLELPQDSTDIHKRNTINRHQSGFYEDIIGCIVCILSQAISAGTKANRKQFPV